jgi:hypothetical protein
MFTKGVRVVIRRLVIALATVLLVSGCFFDRSAALIGNWQATAAGAGSIEFFKDGTVSVSGAVFGVPMSQVGKYKVLDDDRVSFEFGGLLGLAGPTIFRVAVSGSELTLTDTAGNMSRYRKN